MLAGSARRRAILHGLAMELRPKLHRYCARMTGSAVDGQDIVQDALIKALAAPPNLRVIDNPEGWLFRIAHSAALDFLRRRARGPTMQDNEALDMIAVPDFSEHDDEVATMSLRTFMRLPALQRSAVILKDVLGHSLEEVASITGASEPPPSQLSNGGASACARLPRNRGYLAANAVASNARPADQVCRGVQGRDLDTVRTMLADDVKLDLVAKQHKQGKSKVNEYYATYAAAQQWDYAAGVVDGRAAMLVYDREISLEMPAYFVALDFDGDRVVSIHDFLFARYAMDGVDLSLLDPYRQKALPKEIVSGRRDPRKQLCPLILQAAPRYLGYGVKQLPRTSNDRL